MTILVIVIPLLSACGGTTTTPVSQPAPASTSTSMPTPTPAPDTPTATPSPKPKSEPHEVQVTVPLAYEIIDSYTEIVKVLYRDDEEIPGLERESKFGDPVPKGYVTVKNTDNIAGEFTVKFSFWTRNKITIVKDGKEVSWYPMPDEEIFRNYHTGERKLHLEAGESGVAKFIAYRIDAYETRDHGPWFWEYEVIPDIKSVTKIENP